MAETYTPIAFRYAIRMLRNEQDASDMAHDTMVKVFSKLHRYDSNWRFTTWVLSITRNTCIDMLRKRKREAFCEVPDVADRGPSPLEASAQNERERAVHDALDRLPDLYREVLVLYHFEHLKYREIAHLLDVPLGTVMNRIFRARRRMRDYLTDTEATEMTA